MSNGDLLRGNIWLSPRGVTTSAMRFNNYAGVNTNRQTMFQARSARRWGDWGILEIPTAALWFDELALAAAADDELDVLAPAIIDIWG